MSNIRDWIASRLSPAERTRYRDLLLLVTGALFLRLLYVVLSDQHLGLNYFKFWPPDTYTYWAVSDLILGASGNLVNEALFRVGPGYGAILASVRLVFGEGALPPIALNIVLGCLAPVFVYLIAQMLFNSRKISLLAGLLAATSYTGISMSGVILTDQPFYTLHAATTWLFLRGYRDQNWKSFVAAGLIGAVALMVRPSGQFFWLIFLAIVIICPPRLKGSHFRRILLGSSTGLIMLATVGAWTLHNVIKFDTLSFGSNGMITIKNCVIAPAYERFTGEGTIVELRKQWAREDSVGISNFVDYYDNTRNRVVREFKTHPNWMLKTYWFNLEQNIAEPNYYPRKQLPIDEKYTRWVERACSKSVSNYLVLISLVSLLMLLIRRSWLPFMLLGATYFYFSLIVGLSLWQGSRLHYPAEIAWAPLLSYFLFEGIETVSKGISYLKRRSASGTKA